MPWLSITATGVCDRMRFSVAPSLFLADRSRPLKVPCAVEQLPLRRLQSDWPWRVFEVGADEFGTAGFAASTLQHGHPIASGLEPDMALDRADRAGLCDGRFE